MSRLTGTDALGLMEAYQAVYAPKELTEEQVWEEVESWVNSLVEEGYDLSDYTWDDLYEYYVSEGFKPTGYHHDYDPYSSEAGNQSRVTSSRGRRIKNRVKELEKSGDQKKADFIHKAASNFKNQEKGLARQKRNNRRGPGPRRAREDAMRDMEKSGFKEQVELYDIIFSHLLDEGYATTEDGALAIMSNMSEDWIQSIIEDTTNVIRADVRDPRVRTNAITAGGRVPPGEQLIGNIMSRVGSALRGYNPRAIEVRRPAGPGKGSLVSRNVPKPTGGSGGSSGRASTNYGRGF